MKVMSLGIGVVKLLVPRKFADARGYFVETWNRLPAIRKSAPEYYDNLVYHKSWTKLLFQFIFDPELSLFSRIERPNPAKVRNEPVGAVAR